nr:hypothetical protein B0A51_15199 [Rachicladosporium sp. CCFEE 5018]
MSTGGERKRRREATDDDVLDAHPFEKKAKPTFDEDFALWQPQDLHSSPSRSYHSQQHAYDSDGQSSMVSEPGSPQSLNIDEDADTRMADSELDPPGLAHFSQSAESSPTFPISPLRFSSRSRARLESQGLSPRPNTSPLQTHIRQRHPQAYLSSDRLEVPSPVDEDEVPTPPSAADEAGSQLELLTVSDVEMQGANTLPRISVQPDRRSMQDEHSAAAAPDYEAMDSDMAEPFVIRKQRGRSGALSEGNESPMRRSLFADANAMARTRGISMGYRPDCEKCRTRVPGHMNHFF